MSMKLKAALAASAIALMAAPAVQAQAQPEPAAAAEPEDGPVALDEIVVTAQRREANLQDVPFSIMAFSGEQLQKENIQDATDLFAQVPSAYFMSSSSKTYSVIGIRGLTTLLSAPAADLPVAFFADDIYYSSAGDMSLSLYDIEHVEVLRGPQGTLFGRNVTGGAVSVTSRKPQYDEAASVSVGIGNFGLIQTDGFVNGVLIEDRLAGRIAFTTRRNNGPIRNETRDTRLGSESLGSVRASLRFDPTDDLRIGFTVDYTNDEGNGNAARLENFDSSLIPPLSNDPFVSNQGSSTAYRRNLGGAIVRIDWSTPFGDVTSVTGFRRNTAHQERDIDGTPLVVYGNEETVNNRQFTQEVRLASPTDGWFSYVVGAFYMDARNYRRTDYYTNPIPGSIAAGSLAAYGPYPLLNTRAQDANIRSAAVFGEMNFKLFDKFTLEIGGRYTRDDKEGTTFINGSPSPFFFSPAASGPYVIDFKGNWDAFTPKATLKYAFNDDVNVYATVAKGFKGGGFTESLTTAAGLAAAFNPENTINYEAGIKSQWFNNRASLNVSVFRQDTTDLQTQLFLNGINQFANAGEARQQGVELEAAALITDNFRLNIDYAYLDATFIEFGANTGNQLPFAPKHSISIAPRYDLDLASGARLTFAADYSYRSKVPLAEANNVPDFLVDRSQVNLLNGRVEYTSSNGKWNLSLWGKNLTNEAIVSGAYDMSTFTITPAERAAGNRTYWTLYNIPRTYGLTLKYDF